jgi:hypothetical protein
MRAHPPGCPLSQPPVRPQRASSSRSRCPPPALGSGHHPNRQDACPCHHGGSVAAVTPSLYVTGQGRPHGRHGPTVSYSSGVPSLVHQASFRVQLPACSSARAVFGLDFGPHAPLLPLVLVSCSWPTPGHDRCVNETHTFSEPPPREPDQAGAGEESCVMFSGSVCGLAWRSLDSLARSPSPFSGEGERS